VAVIHAVGSSSGRLLCSNLRAKMQKIDGHHFGQVVVYSCGMQTSELCKVYSGLQDEFALVACRFKMDPICHVLANTESAMVAYKAEGCCHTLSLHFCHDIVIRRLWPACCSVPPTALPRLLMLVLGNCNGVQAAAYD
jgi:hypothetical protein